MFQSCGPFLKVEQFARATIPLILPAAITSTKGSSLLPRTPKTASVEKPAIAFCVILGTIGLTLFLRFLKFSIAKSIKLSAITSTFSGS